MCELSCARPSFTGAAETKIILLSLSVLGGQQLICEIHSRVDLLYMHIKCRISHGLIAQLHLCAADDAQWDQSLYRARSPHSILMAAWRCWSRIQCWKKRMQGAWFSYTLSMTVCLPALSVTESKHTPQDPDL